jgi:membrane-associated protease RseP (regulator of RpoE activity)
LAAAPASAVAGPSNDPWSTAQSQTIGRFEWSTSKGRLGVMVMSLTPELRAHFAAPADRGVLVARVDPATPAAKAGIEVGDVIVEVRGRKIDAAPDVLSAINDLGKGAQVTITVLRDGKPRSLDATLTDHATANAWSSPWLRDWRDWLKPFEPTKHDTDSAVMSNWLGKLRELFEANNATQPRQHS